MTQDYLTPEQHTKPYLSFGRADYWQNMGYGFGVRSNPG